MLIFPINLFYFPCIKFGRKTEKTGVLLNLQIDNMAEATNDCGSWEAVGVKINSIVFLFSHL